ncbi:hypothetical protein MTO96_045000, partial [Rhipicephalus appendiculatus]
VIQKRGQYGNNVFYFYRDWTEYSSGFGDPAEEYWIGNQALHALTSGDEVMALRIFLGNTTDEGVWIDYESVRISGGSDYYRMQIGELLGPEGWDAMSSCNNMAFSTFNSDSDQSTDNCAVKYKGAWWYKYCFDSNLNGLNLNGYHSSDTAGIDWMADSTGELGSQYSYPWVRMMIRPAGYEGRSSRSMKNATE